MSATGTAPFIGIYSGDMANLPTVSWGNTGGISTPVARKYDIMKVTLKRNAEIKRLRDPNGQMRGYLAKDRVRMLSIEMVVRGGVSGGIAAAATAAVDAPLELSKITIAKVVSATDAVISGEWIYEEGAENSLSGDDEATLKFDCYQFYTDAGVVISADTILAVLS